MDYFQYSSAGIWVCECFNSSVTGALTTEAQRIIRVDQKIFQIILNTVTQPHKQKNGCGGGMICA